MKFAVYHCIWLYEKEQSIICLKEKLTSKYNIGSYSNKVIMQRMCMLDSCGASEGDLKSDVSKFSICISNPNCKLTQTEFDTTYNL